MNKDHFKCEQALKSGRVETLIDLNLATRQYSVLSVYLLTS